MPLAISANPMTADEFIADLPAERRAAMLTLHRAIRKAVPKLAPEIMTMMSTTVIAYGRYRYKSASGREGDWFQIGLGAGKGAYSLHVCTNSGGDLIKERAGKLGKVKTGRSCINFTKLEDLKLDAAMALVKEAAKSGGLNAVK